MSDSLSAALATLDPATVPRHFAVAGRRSRQARGSTAVPVLDDVLTPGGLPHGRVTLLAAAGRGPSGPADAAAVAGRTGQSIA